MLFFTGSIKCLGAFCFLNNDYQLQQKNKKGWAPCMLTLQIHQRRGWSPPGNKSPLFSCTQKLHSAFLWCICPFDQLPVSLDKPEALIFSILCGSQLWGEIAWVHSPSVLFSPRKPEGLQGCNRSRELVWREGEGADFQPLCCQTPHPRRESFFSHKKHRLLSKPCACPGSKGMLFSALTKAPGITLFLPCYALASPLITSLLIW